MAEAENSGAAAAVETNGRQKRRSPSYPSLDVHSAIEKAKLIFKADRGAPAPAEVIANHLSSTIKSSGFLQNLGTLQQYGLLEELEGKPRRFRTTKDTLDLALLPDADVRKDAIIKRIALRPKAFRELWQEYGTDLPSDQTLIYDLVANKRFGDTAAIDLIRKYKKTIAFAKLSAGDTVVDANQGRPPKIGDLVQWESAGALRFPEPRRLLGISEDGLWAYVDGTMTGLPFKEIQLVEAAESVTPGMQGELNSEAPTIPPTNPLFKPAERMPPESNADKRRYVLTVDTGNVVVEWPTELSMEDCETVERWLEGMKKKIRRAVKDETQQN